MSGFVITMTQISNDELTRICQFLTLADPPFYPLVSQYLADMYVTGCRAEEPLAFDRWTWNSPDADHVTLDPFKLSHDRTFKKTMLSESLLFAIENQVKPYGNLSLRQLEYSMRQVSPFGTASLTDRYIIAYIFRYFKVRDLLNDGWTQAEINTWFGWNNPAMSERYTDAELFIYTNSIPTETFNVRNYNAMVLVDANGNNIVNAN